MPPNPKALTPARRTGWAGHGVSVLTIWSRPMTFSREASGVEMLIVRGIRPCAVERMVLIMPAMRRRR